MPKKMAFVDHSFHEKSAATHFLLELFKNKYQVDIYWDESWQNKKKLDLKRFAEKAYDVVVMFQVLNYSAGELESTGCKSIVLIPMYDFSFWTSNQQWLELKGVKFLNFSIALHKKVKKLGLQSKYIKYFPNPDDYLKVKNPFESLQGFFWQRTDKITWNHVRRLIKNTEFSHFHIHGAADPPGYRLILPSEEEKIKYKIKISKWFEKREDYFSISSSANVYFAPRPHEGIGMAFLEAMAQGQCVVAPDNPTMNEYITHGQNGYLYDLKNPQPIDFSNAEDVSRNARAYMQNGYRKWVDEKQKIISYIESPVEPFKFSVRNYFQRTVEKLKFKLI